jgi:hypothetical protein
MKLFLLASRPPVSYIESMKTGSRFLGSKFLGLCASIGCAGLVHAQVWQPIPVSLSSVSVVTTGGIPYAQYKWYLGGWEREDSIGPLIRNGSNFSYNFDIEGETGLPYPMYILIENTTVVLGNLAPGTYTLTTTSWNAPVATNTFTVPTNSPVLQPIGFAADGSFQIQLLNGVTNVSYVLQCSTNYVNWTSLSTNSVGQPLRDPSPVLPGSRFYRVQILPQ